MNLRNIILSILIVVSLSSLKAQTDSISGKPAETSAQENQESARQRTSIINFDPKQFQLQKRYRPMENDTAFGAHGLRRLYFGGGVGVMALTDKTATTTSLMYHGYLGYRFTPVHALRFDFSYADLSKENSDKKMKSLGFGFSYQADLTHFIGGYKPQRLYTIATLLSGGARVQPDAPDTKIRPYLSVGLHISGNPMENLTVFVEPFVGVIGRQSYLMNRKSASALNVMYGFTGGIQFSLDKFVARYPLTNPLYRSWYFDIAHGLSFNLSGDGNVMKTAGSSRQIYIGRWFNPYMGMRVGADFTEVGRQFDDTRGIPENITYQSTQVLLGGGVELTLSALNFSKKHRNDMGKSPWDVSLNGGVRFGWIKRANPLSNPSLLECFYWAPTVAVQGMYRVAPGAYIYVEPRWLRPTYYTPYQNTPHSITHQQHIITASVGARIFRPNKNIRAEIGGDDGNIFVHHAWAGIAAGVQRPFSWTNMTMSDMGIGFMPTVGVSVGYDITPLHSARVDASWQRLVGNVFENNVLSHYVANKADLRLMYMFNLSNFWQGTRTDSPFKIYAEAGPVFSMIPSTDTKPAKVNVGPAVGIYTSMRVTPCLDVTVESLGEFHTKRGFIPAGPSLPGQVEMAFNAGVRYHFVPGSAGVILFQNLDLKPWNKGPFIETAYGVALPFATGHNMLSMGGQAYRLSAGLWLNELFGARVGLAAHEDFWKFEDATGTRSSSAFISGRLELVLNPLALLNSRKESDVAPKWDFNMSLGMDLGGRLYANRFQESYKNFYTGFTASMQGLYRVSQGMQIFVEPRYITGGAQDAFTASVGLRVTRATPYLHQMIGDKGFTPKGLYRFGAFFGVSGGLFEPYASVINTSRRFSFSGSAHIGYRFTRLHSVRASASYEKAKCSVAGLSEYYPVLSARLMYRFALSTMWTQNEDTRWTLFANAGPALDIRLKDVVGMKRYSFGLAGSMAVDYRVAGDLHLYLEPLLQYNFKQILPHHSDNYHNRLKLGVEVGVSYHLK